MDPKATVEQRGEGWWVRVVTDQGKLQEYACGTQKIAERLARLFGETRPLARRNHHPEVASQASSS